MVSTQRDARPKTCVRPELGSACEGLGDRRLRRLRDELVVLAEVHQHQQSASARGTDSDAILAPMLNGELRYRPDQFLCLGVINAAPMLLVAGPAARAGDIAALLKDRDRPIAVGSCGLGANSELLAQDFARRASLNVVHVPYRGIAPLVQDLLSGQTEMSLPLGGSVPEMVAARTCGRWAWHRAPDIACCRRCP